jgi:SAM-dependent methyltransferase
MFDRNEDTYIADDSVLDKILSDPAQPLGQIAKIIPDEATVLDIGAGNGMLGRVLQRARKSVSIDAIEPNVYAAKLSEPFYRKVFQGYAQEHSQIINLGNYEYIVLADVIEHVPDPASFLRDILKIIPKSAKLIISIPNVAFGGIRLSLLNGQFNYVNSGLLERTHLRFFTLDSARKLFSSLPIYPEHILSLERSFYRMEFPRSALGASPITIFNLAKRYDARAYQYLFVLAQKPCDAIVEHRGASMLTVLMDAVLARPAIKKLVLSWRKH